MIRILIRKFSYLLRTRFRGMIRTLIRKIRILIGMILLRNGADLPLLLRPRTTASTGLNYESSSEAY